MKRNAADGLFTKPSKVGAPAAHRIPEMGARSRLFPWFLALALFLLPAIAAAWSGKVVGVTDGDPDTEEEKDLDFALEDDVEKIPEGGAGYARCIHGIITNLSGRRLEKKRGDNCTRGSSETSEPRKYTSRRCPLNTAYFSRTKNA